jgi:HlyD family secretion protein
MNHNRLGYYVLGILVLLALALAIFGPLPFREEGRTEAEQSPQGAFFTDPAAGLTAKGVVESEEVVEIGSQVKGIINALLVEEGEPVKQGQLLVQLEGSKIEARIALVEAEVRAARAHLREVKNGPRREDLAAAHSTLDGAAAAFKEAREEYERQDRLLAKGAATQVERNRAEEAMRIAEARRDEAQAQWEKLQAGTRPEQIEQARAREERAMAELVYERRLLADYAIQAPVDGLVSQIYRDQNETVDIGTPILTIVDPQRLRVQAEVEETDLGQVKTGQAAIVAAEAFGDRLYRGKVTQVFSTVEKKQQRTFDPMASFDINTQKIYISLDNYTGLVHGMTVNVRFSK